MGEKRQQFVSQNSGDMVIILKVFELNYKKKNFRKTAVKAA